MCVLEGRRKAPITLDLPLKQTETEKTTFHTERGRRKKKKKIWVPLTSYVLTAPVEVREPGKMQAEHIWPSPDFLAI